MNIDTCSGTGNEWQAVSRDWYRFGFSAVSCLRDQMEDQ